MAARCPHSPLRGTGWIEGWRITFGGEGWDGALPTLVEEADSQVFVALYDVTSADENTLDEWESADTGLYRKVHVRVATLDGEVTAWVYVLNDFEGGIPSARTLASLPTPPKQLLPQRTMSRTCGHGLAPAAGKPDSSGGPTPSCPN
jgi:gamma-glutamylcyclotransferase (GGCT)/AIG2-like uncharacterized protein YtfP